MARELEMEDHYTRLGSAGSRLPTAVIGAVGAAVLLTVGSVVHLSRDVSEMQDAHIQLKRVRGPTFKLPCAYDRRPWPHSCRRKRSSWPS